MFAKLKKKIQEESQSIGGAQEESEKISVSVSNVSPTGPGLASPVSSDYPGGTMFSHSPTESSDAPDRLDSISSIEALEKTNDVAESPDKGQHHADIQRLTQQTETLQMKIKLMEEEAVLRIEEKRQHEADMIQYEEKITDQDENFREQIKQLKDQLETSEKARDRERVKAQNNQTKLENCQEDWLEREIDTERRITRLEEDLQTAKVSLAEKQRELHHCLGQLQKQRSEKEDLAKERTQNRTKIQQLELSAESLEKTVSSLEEELTANINEKNALLLRNAQLSQELESAKRRSSQQADDTEQDIAQKDATIARLQQSLDETDQKMSGLQDELQRAQTHKETVVNQVVSEEINNLKEQVQAYEDQLAEKNKSIKMLQQRLGDLKKTLQRELKVQSLPNDEIQETTSQPSCAIPDPEVNIAKKTNTQSHSGSQETSVSESHPASISITESAHKHLEHKHHVHHRLPKAAYVRPYSQDIYQSSLPASSNLLTAGLTSHQNTALSSRKNNDQLVQHEINFEYLKHVILKFMLSRENEAIHLIKAVSMLLHFSPEEQQLIHETLEWKMSWFGSKPQVGKGQLAKVVPSTF